MHLAGTVAEWLGHVLNVITGRMDRPGGRRFEPGYVDALRLSDLAKAKPHKSRLAGRDMVAGAHALSELPAEITTPGRGQIKAMLINCTPRHRNSWSGRASCSPNPSQRHLPTIRSSWRTGATVTR